MENGGRFSDHQVDQLRRLGGWSPKSAIVHIYIRKIIEEYSDTLALITPGRHGLIAIKKGSNATFCLLQGLATMENGGRFTDNQVDQLRRLEGGVVPQKCHRPLILRKLSRNIRTLWH